jgi:hypothetical protein
MDGQSGDPRAGKAGQGYRAAHQADDHDFQADGATLTACQRSAVN